MAQLTNLEKVRHRRIWRKRIRSLLLLILFAAVVFVASMVVYHKGEMDLKTAVGDITAELSTGGGYPVLLPGGKLLQMTSMDNALVVMADGNLYTYSNTGRRILDLQHGMMNPTVTTAGSRILAYDRGANKVMILSRSGVVRQIAVDFPLYDGDIAKNGNFALATGCDTHLAMVTVYNGEGDRLYRYKFADHPVLCVSLADGREAMAVGLVDVRSGEYLSSIARYQFSETEPLANVELPGELVLALDFKDGNGVRAITDSRAVALDGNLKEQADYRYGDQRLLRFRIGGDGKILLHLQDVTGVRQGQVVLLDERMRQLCSIPLEGDLIDMKLDGGGVYLMRAGQIEAFDFTGQSVAKLPVSGLGLFQPMNGALYYTTASELCAIDVKDIADAYAMLPPESAASRENQWENLKDAILGGSSGSKEQAEESGPSDVRESASGVPPGSREEEDAAVAAGTEEPAAEKGEDAPLPAPSESLEELPAESTVPDAGASSGTVE